MSKKEKIIVAVIVVSTIVLFSIWQCPFVSIFGISCPGCGMTRAFIAASQFDFQKAFKYHPLFWLVGIVIIYLLFRRKIKKQLKNWDIYEKIILVAIIVLYLGVYLFRIVNRDPVLEFHFEKSIFYKLINWLYSGGSNDLFKLW